MVKRRSSMDGFVPRRSAQTMGELHLPRPTTERNINEKNPTSLYRRSVEEVQKEDTSSLAQSRHGLSRADIDASLQGIDDDGETPVEKTRKKPHHRKKLIKRIMLAILAIFLLIGVIFIVRLVIANGNIFKGDILGFVQSKPLKLDEKGRANFLLLGTSEDDPGHEGAMLTDSMMIVSINPKAHDVYMFSIPRDLYVRYGMACNSGYAGKINEYFSCVNDDYTSSEAEEERLAASRKFIGEIVGMDLQYAVHTNYTVVRDLVGAVGGVRVKIESEDPRGIMDANFDWKCGPNPSERRRRCPPNGHFIQYPNGYVDLDAEHALYLSMARGAGGEGTTYGLPNSNFDREKNQQKIIVALKEKATSAGTLANPGKTLGMINALGDNLRTNIETGEVRTLMDVATKIENKSIKSLTLNGDDDTDPILTTDFVGGASAVVPVAGTYDYSELRLFIQKNVYASAISREAANVMVLNGSGVGGVAMTEGEKLNKLGMNVESVGNAPTQDHKTTVVYKLGKEGVNPATKNKLEKLYSTTIKTTQPPVDVTGETDFVVIIGSSAQSK